MSIKINTTGISILKSGSSIEIAAEAAVKSIEASCIMRDDIGLMINAGIYKDSNIGEPSLASLIQQRLNLNLEPAFGKVNPTMSFDQRNGAAGFITAAHTVDAWLTMESTRYAMIVASDSHPSKSETKTDEFPITPSGSSVIFEKSDGEGFRYYNFSSAGEEIEGITGYFNISEKGGREKITISIAENYAENLLSTITSAVRNAVESCSLDISRCYVVAYQPVASFSKKLAGNLGLPQENVIDLYTKYGYIHSAAIGTGLHIINSEGTSPGKDAIICAAPGAGVGIATAVYFLPEEP